MFKDFNAYKTDKKKWLPVWSTVIGGLAATLGLEMLLSIIILIVAAVISQEMEPSIPMVISLYSTAAGILGTFWIIRGQKWKAHDVGVVLNKKTTKEYLLGALLGLVMLIFSIVPAFLVQQAQFSLASISAATIGMWVLYGIGFIIQSFSEEYLCRGLIMKRLNDRYNIWWTLFLQAVIFMMLHAGNPGIGMTTILECEMNGHHLLTGADFGIEDALTTTFVTLIVIIALTPKMFTIIKAKSLSVESAATTDENISTQEDTPC